MQSNIDTDFIAPAAWKFGGRREDDTWLPNESSICLPAIDEKPRAVHPVRVNRTVVKLLRKGSPLVFDSSVVNAESLSKRDMRAGDFAAVFDAKSRKLVGSGLLEPDPGSTIRVRMLHMGNSDPINATNAASMWRSKVRVATQRRRDANLPTPGVTDGFRLVAGEFDGMSGLVIDRFGSMLVLKVYSTVWFPHLSDIVAAAIAEVEVPVRDVYLRLARSIGADAARVGLRDGARNTIRHSGSDEKEAEASSVKTSETTTKTTTVSSAATTTFEFLENGLHFEVDPVRGHKTGFYLDQRDNRRRVRSLVELYKCEKVLNICAYSGGFSVAAAAGGASLVESLDVSALALAAADRNFGLNFSSADDAGVHKREAGLDWKRSFYHTPNGVVCHTLRHGDAFEQLRAMLAANKSAAPGALPFDFDMIIVDPPSFAKSAAETAKALQAYRRLNEYAVRLLRPRGGILVTCSCSSRVTAGEFYSTVNRAAAGAASRLELIDPDDDSATNDTLAQSASALKGHTGHAVDHSDTSGDVHYPHGEYLKAMFCQVCKK
jgi:23S rRNA (cytosine1962-C5)-methyltransferase